MHRFYDLMGLAGLVITNMFTWVDSFEISVRIIGMIGGILLVVLGIFHKIIQIKNEKQKAVLTQIQETQNKTKDIIKESTIKVLKEKNLTRKQQ